MPTTNKFSIMPSNIHFPFSCPHKLNNDAQNHCCESWIYFQMIFIIFNLLSCEQISSSTSQPLNNFSPIPYHSITMDNTQAIIHLNFKDTYPLIDYVQSICLISVIFTHSIFDASIFLALLQ